MTLTTSRPGERPKQSAFIIGFVISALVVFALGEAYVRLSLPGDIRTRLGMGSAETGIYQPDPVLGATYRSYEDFAAQNAARLREHGPLDAPKPTWLFFGNSFVQANGMIAETAARLLPDKRIFALRQNILLPLRAAQARLLLEAGLRPERIFFVIISVDLLHIGQRPLAFIEVSPEGAIGTRLRWPDPPLGDLVTASQLATIAWIRSGRAEGDPGFSKRRIGTPSPRVLDDLTSILEHLAETSRRFNVPATVMVLPDREQIFGQSPFVLQGSVKEIARRLNLDFYDARGPLLPVSDKRSLFLPDWHFTERGNDLLVKGLIGHVRALKTP